MWCVIADNGDEYWVYGIWPDQDQAEAFIARQTDYPDIEYTVASFLEHDNGK